LDWNDHKDMCILGVKTAITLEAQS
jgi:hypothetical protein